MVSPCRNDDVSYALIFTPHSQLGVLRIVVL